MQIVVIFLDDADADPVNIFLVKIFVTMVEPGIMNLNKTRS